MGTLILFIVWQSFWVYGIYWRDKEIDRLRKNYWDLVDERYSNKTSAINTSLTICGGTQYEQYRKTL